MSDEPSTDMGMYQRVYWQIQAVLDEVLGTEEHDGAGEGIVTDVWLALAAAERRGWDKAVAAIRDSDRYHQWWIDAAMDGDDLPPDREAVRAVADYLETLTEEAEEAET